MRQRSGQHTPDLSTSMLIRAGNDGRLEAFVDGLPACLDGWDLLEVAGERSRHVACNGLRIDPENDILACHEPGIAVHRVGFGDHQEGGGSIRCATHPLVRRLGGCDRG